MIFSTYKQAHETNKKVLICVQSNVPIIFVGVHKQCFLPPETVYLCPFLLPLSFRKNQTNKQKNPLKFRQMETQNKATITTYAYITTKLNICPFIYGL